ALPLTASIFKFLVNTASLRYSSTYGCWFRSPLRSSAFEPSAERAPTPLGLAPMRLGYSLASGATGVVAPFSVPPISIWRGFILRSRQFFHTRSRWPCRSVAKQLPHLSTGQCARASRPAATSRGRTQRLDQNKVEDRDRDPRRGYQVTFSND